MPDATDDVTRRIFANRRRRSGSRLSMSGMPLLCSAALILLTASSVNVVAPRVRGATAEDLAYYRECSVVTVLLPRLIPIGLIAGIVAFVLALKMGDGRASVFCGSILATFAVSLLVACALWIGVGSNEAGYANADIGDVFRVAVLPIGLPASVGAALGVGVAAVS